MFSKQVRLFVMVMVNFWWTLPAVAGTEVCSCYTFHGDLRRWYKSRQHCLDNGGDLVSLETTEEWSRINDEIQHRTTDRLGYNEWHIGLTKLTGVWRWMNNKTLAYDRWQEGEPEQVTNKPFVTMARNWPIGTQGLFNSLREDIPRARICEYERSCVSIRETCRKLSGSFAVNNYTTPKPIRLSTALFPTYMTYTTEQTTRQKTIPVFKGENPTSKPNSKTKQKTPFYIVVVVIILGALIFGCCCVVIIAFRWKKRRKTEKIIKEEEQTNSKAAIKTNNSSDSSSDSDGFDDPQQEGERDLANISNEPNVAINDTNSRPDYKIPPLRHEYAEIIIIRDDDDDDDNSGNDCNGRERAKEHKVRFACDENDERLRNECIPNGKRNQPTKEDYNLNGSYLVKHCKKHRKNGKNGKLEETSPGITVGHRKQKGLLRINGNSDPETMETQQENNHDMDIVKLDIVLPTKEAQYASIVEIYPQEHDGITNRNDKKPFLKTFAPVNGYHHENAKNFKEHEKNGRDVEEYEQIGKNRFEEYEQNGTNFEDDGGYFVNYEQNGRTFDDYEPTGQNSEQNGRDFDERDLNLYTSVDKSVNNAHTSPPNEPVYAVVDKSKKTNKKPPYPNVRMNYVELAEFDKKSVVYTKTMPPRYQSTRYTEVEIPNEWDYPDDVTQ